MKHDKTRFKSLSLAHNLIKDNQTINNSNNLAMLSKYHNQKESNKDNIDENNK